MLETRASMDNGTHDWLIQLLHAVNYNVSSIDWHSRVLAHRRLWRAGLAGACSILVSKWRHVLQLTKRSSRIQSTKTLLESRFAILTTNITRAPRCVMSYACWLASQIMEIVWIRGPNALGSPSCLGVALRMRRRSALFLYDALSYSWDPKRWGPQCYNYLTAVNGPDIKYYRGEGVRAIKGSCCFFSRTYL